MKEWNIVLSYNYKQIKNMLMTQSWKIETDRRNKCFWNEKINKK